MPNQQKIQFLLLFLTIQFLLTCTSVQHIPDENFQQVKGNIEVYDLSLNNNLIDYFLNIAFGSEYRGGDGLVTWNRPVSIYLSGDYTFADSLEVQKVLSELNNLLLFQSLNLVEKEANILLLFTDLEGFKKYAPKHAWNNNGYFYINWHPKTKHVRTGRILIDTSIIQTHRNHVIREEITQVLGLMRDSDKYPDSIFYQNYSENGYYAKIDREILKLWDALKPVSGFPQKSIRNMLLDILNSSR